MKVRNSTCIVCKRKNSGQIIWKELKSWDVDGIYSYKKCSNCSLISIYPMSSGKRIISYYNDYSYWGVNNKNHTRYYWLQHAEKEYGYIYRYFKNKRKGRILDIGTGTGLFLFKLKEDGWKVLGTEISGLMREYARKMFKIRIVTPRIIFNKKYTSFFDIVLLNNVLEHLVDPAMYIKNIRKLLKSQGLLLIVTPNSDSIGYNLFRSKWYHLDPGRHLYIFNRYNLKLLLENNGFNIRNESHGYRLHNLSGIFESIRHLFSNVYNEGKVESLYNINKRNVFNFSILYLFFKQLFVLPVKIISNMIAFIEQVVKKGEVIIVEADKR